MTLHSDSNEEFEYSLNHCLCFDHPEEESFTLMVSGLCSNPDYSSEAEIRIIVDGERIASLQPGTENDCPTGQVDGQTAPPRFQLYLPLHRRLDTGDEIGIEFKAGGKSSSLIRPVTNVRSFIEQYADEHPLGEKVRRKLFNLLLNETERIHHLKGIKSTPIYLKLDPSWQCELDCPYCHANVMRKNGFSMKDLDAVTFENTMDRFGDNLIAVHLGIWGEPFRNPATFGYIRTMKDYGIHVTADSHLNHDFTDEAIEDLVSSGLDLLVASLDGATEKTYGRYRKGGSLEKALSNLEKIVKKKKESASETPRTHWQFLAFDGNKDEIDMAREKAEQIGCDEFVVRQGETFKAYEPFLEYRDNSFMDSMTPGIREKMVQYCNEREAKGAYFGCDLLYHQLVIHADGAIHPCTYYHEPRLLYKSVHLRKDVWNTAHFKNARRLFIKAPPVECQGYNPCLNCSVVTDEEHRGYVPSDMDFFSAFELLTGDTPKM